MIVTLTLNPAIDKTMRIKSFARGALNRFDNVRLDAAGKGVNVSAAVSALGGKTLAMGFVGGKSGKVFLEMLAKKGIEHDFIAVDGEVRTNCKVMEEDGTLTELNEPGVCPSPFAVAEMKRKLLSVASAENVFVLSGSIPKTCDAGFYAETCCELKKSGAKVIVDADGEPLRKSIEAGAAFLKPNRFEITQYFGKDVDCDTGTLCSMCKELLKGGAQFVALSMGADGAIFASGEGVWQARALKVNVLSTVGAGDCMVAAMAFGLDKKINMKEIAALSLAASAAACETEGTNPPTRERVRELAAKVILEDVN